jgi:hypothetical protein
MHCLTCLLSACCKVQKTYYPKEMLESEVPYCRQKIHGTAVWYYDNGKKRMEATMKRVYYTVHDTLLPQRCH